MKQKQQQSMAETTGTVDLEQRIQSRAFELYSARGQGPGHELEDWLEAEREVRDLAGGAPAHAMEIRQ